MCFLLTESYLLSFRTNSREFFSFPIADFSAASRANSCKACWDIKRKLSRVMCVVFSENMVQALLYLYSLLKFREGELSMFYLNLFGLQRLLFFLALLIRQINYINYTADVNNMK